MADKEKWQNLVEIIATLRGEGGCPWDRKQTHTSLKRCMIEEAYEVVDAIDKQDDAALCDELGDVLLQVVMHAQLAAEQGRFTIDDVVEGVSNKMVRRHPHIFGDASAEDADQVLAIWEQMKAQEKNSNSESKRGIMKLNDNLPALMLAQKAQDKAHRVGFDWPDISGARAKLTEELAEFDAAATAEEQRQELGDLLFSVVNVGRFVEVEAEDALRFATKKFVNRFNYIEQALESQGKDWRELTLAQLDELWDEAKEQLS